MQKIHIAAKKLALINRMYQTYLPYVCRWYPTLVLTGTKISAPRLHGEGIFVPGMIEICPRPGSLEPRSRYNSSRHALRALLNQHAAF